MLSDGLFGISPYFFPGIVTNTSFNNNSKMYHDSYEVYVNQDYIGSKVLINQGEDVKDIDGYLKDQGVGRFESVLDGGRYLIHTEDHSIAKRAKDVLNIYLNIR